MPFPASTRIGPYELVASLGAGGMGEVYRARDTRLARDVAVKVLSGASGDLASRFEREARAAGALNHPNIVALLDAGTDQETRFLVSELLEGQTLREKLRGGPLSLEKAIGFAVQALHGLAAAHEKGIVHRDLKPENLFITREGTLKILDFGLAKLMPVANWQLSSATQPGTLLGSVGYMSPEQASGTEADHRSDIFSIGAILYEMLAGRRAFPGESAIAVLNAILTSDPPDLSASNPEISRELACVVQRCLEKDPINWFQNARDLGFQLQLLFDRKPNRGPAREVRPPPFEGLIGESAAMAAVRGQIQSLFSQPADARRLPFVLIEGETGTGKGLLARVLHRAGPRRARPFVHISCAGMEEAALEAELFGETGPASVPARSGKIGGLVSANGGMLFLDEIELLPERLQEKLLRSLDGSPVGGGAAIDVWLVSATTDKLRAAVESGRFRPELYHRLAVLVLRLPPLRERGNDVLLLAQHFLVRVAGEYGLPPKKLSAAARRALLAHSWPGNVRELGNVVERAALLDQAKLLTVEALGLPQSALVETRTGRGNRDHAMERVPPANDLGPIRWERRHVTMLRAAVLPPTGTGMTADLAPALDLLVQKAQSFGGRIEELDARGATASFGADPLDDAATCAAHAAVALQKAAARAVAADAGPWDLRIGLHVDQMLVGRFAGRAEIDSDAKRAVRDRLEQLVAEGASGDVLVTAEAAPFLGRRFALLPVPSSGPSAMGAFRIAGSESAELGPNARRSAFVGRRAELELLERRSEDCRPGRICVVDLVGEAGIGKSRLLHEFRAVLESRRFLILQGYCTAEGSSTPFRPFIEVVRTAFQLEERETPAELASKVTRGMERLGLATGGLPFLLTLLGLPLEGDGLRGLDAENVGARIREALLDLVRARCRYSPTALVLDDLHWLDRASQDLLLRLVEEAEPLPLLVLCAFRPPQRVPWSGRPNVVELHLEGLSAESCAQLARHCFGDDTPAAELTRMIADRCEGNPLIAEEISRYLIESGDLQRTAEGLTLTPAERGLPLPGTVQNVLGARIDKLPEDERILLRIASVIGERARLPIVRSVAVESPSIERALQSLQAQELISVSGDELRFKHALIRDAVYQGLVPSSRAALHLQVAEAIERVQRERIGEWAEALAYHYGCTSHVEKTVRYLAMAGEKSLRVYALVEADRRFREVLRLLEAVPGCADEAFQIDVLLNLLRVLRYRADFREILRLMEQCRPRVEALGDRRRLSEVLFWEGMAHLAAFRSAQSRPLLEKALALGEEIGDEACIANACWMLIWLNWMSRQPNPRENADRLARRTLTLARRLGDVALTAEALVCLAINDISFGRYQSARTICAEVLELGRSAGAPRVLAMASFMAAHVSVFDERYQEALEQAEECLRYSSNPLDHTTARAAKGAALAFMGRTREGFEMLRDLRRELVAGDWLFVLTTLDIPFGAAMVLDGRMAAGVRWIEQSIERFTQWGTVWTAAFGHMVLGEIYLRLIAPEQKPPVRVLLKNLPFLLRAIPGARRNARRHLEEAVRIAREMDIPATLARSLLDLGLLRAAKNRWTEARAYLDEAGEISARFDFPALGAKVAAALQSVPRPSLAR